MKKFLSAMAALLLAVFTATGVHAANPSQAGDVKLVSSSIPGITVTPKAQADIPVVSGQKGIVVAFEVEGAKEGQKYTITVSSPEFKNGQTYNYTHYKSDTNPTVVDAGTVTASGTQLTLTLTGASPVVIEAASAAGTGAKSASATAAGSGVAVPKTGVDLK